MKIILLKDVPKVGRKFEIKDVSEGYATNMLFPKGLAMIATPQAVQKIQLETSKNESEKKIQGDLLLKNLESLKELQLTMTEKANEKGHLFAGVTKEMILAEIFKKVRLNIDPDSVIFEKPIKTVGEHTITIHAAGKKVEFIVTIEGGK